MRIDEHAVRVLAVARLTGLITSDVLTAPARERIRGVFAGRRGQDTVAYLLGDAEADGCHWCVSMWVAAVLVPLTHRYGHRTPVKLATAVLACSQVAGMIGRIGRR